MLNNLISNESVFFIGKGDFLSASSNSALIIEKTDYEEMPFSAYAIDLDTRASDAAYCIVENEPKNIGDVKKLFDQYIGKAGIDVLKDTYNLMEG